MRHFPWDIITSMAWLVPLILVAPQGPVFVVQNPSPVPRHELVRTSLPLPRGRYPELEWVEVAGDAAPVVPLVRWPDGSLAVVQVQARVRLGAGETKKFTVQPQVGALPRKEGGSWFWPDDLALHTELEDPWGKKYLASLSPDPTAGANGVIRASPRVRVRRYRGVHRAGDTQFFTSIAYLVTFVGERRAELTLVLDNGAHSASQVGPARFREFALVIEDPHLRVLPRFIRENNLRPPSRVEGMWRQQLLGPSDQLYLGDATAKAWRFDLFLDGENVGETEREAAARIAEEPLRPLPELAWTRSTRAFGAHGGPAPGPGRATLESLEIHRRWRTEAEFGPFGGFGDPLDAAANGTPRNGPSALHNALRFSSPNLVYGAEGMVLQQTLRPTPGQPVRVPEAAAALRQGMSPRTLQLPHGFTALDYEHFSVDLLYDYYWLTGDPLARDELVRVGRGLLRVLAEVPFLTSRGEGWCMQAAVLIARATGDTGLVEAVRGRFRERVEHELGGPDALYVLRQPRHSDVLGGDEPFDAPWQMAAFIHGAHAMFQQTGERRFADAAVHAAKVMAGPGWVDEVGPKYILSATDPAVFMMPVAFGPRAGTAVMQIGGFVLAAQMASSESERAMFRRRSEFLFEPYDDVAERSQAQLNTWFQLYLDFMARGR